MEIIFALLLPLPLSVSPLAWLSFHSGYPVARLRIMIIMVSSLSDFILI